MLIPYDTDAPIYHYPIATGAMIAINVLAFLAIAFSDAAQVDPWILEWGKGLHPVQWVTSSFMHANLLHLLGNMLFLWIYGLIVEGKIGWWRFLIVYLGIGVTQNIIEQTLTLGASGGGSLGASSIIFGLMAISLVWAPKNDVQCMFFIYFHPLMFDCPIMVLVGLSLVFEVVVWGGMAMVHVGMGFAITSQILHLMGAGLGAAVGVVMLRKGWVDCENWDLFSVLAGKQGMPMEQWEKVREEDPSETAQREKQTANALSQIHQIIEDGQPALAYRAHLKMKQSQMGWELPEPDLLRIIASYHELGQWTDSIPAMAEYIKTYEEHGDPIRLRLGQILLERQHRPAQAIRVLAAVQAERLSPRKRAQLAALMDRARQQHELDPYEIPTEDW